MASSKLQRIELLLDETKEVILSLGKPSEKLHVGLIVNDLEAIKRKLKVSDEIPVRDIAEKIASIARKLNL